MQPEKLVEYEVIEGILIPVRWGPGGEVSQVSLMTFDEAEYHVDLAAVAHDLRTYLRKHIRLLGRTHGRRIVEVTAVEIPATGLP